MWIGSQVSPRIITAIFGVESLDVLTCPVVSSASSSSFKILIRAHFFSFPQHTQDYSSLILSYFLSLVTGLSCLQGELVLPVLEENDLNVRCRAIVDAICRHPYRYSVVRPRCAASLTLAATTMTAGTIYAAYRVFS
jgi:hypothetical protein